MIPFLEELEMDGEDFNFKVFLQTRRNFVYAIAAATGALLLAWFVLRPQAFELWDSYQEWLDIKDEISQLNQKRNVISQLNTERIVIEEDEIQQALPSEKPLRLLLNTLDQVTFASAIELTELELSPGLISTQSAQVENTPRGDELYDSLEITVTVEGRLREINRFLNTMENVAPFTNVTQLSLTDRSRDATEISTLVKQFQADITMTTYFYTGEVQEISVSTVLPRIGAEEEATLDAIQDLEFFQYDQQRTIRGGLTEDLFGGVSNVDSGSPIGDTSGGGLPLDAPEEQSEADVAPTATEAATFDLQ